MAASPSVNFWQHRPFWMLSLAIFLGAYCYGISAVSATWLPQDLGWTTRHLFWAPLGFVIGILLGGISADGMGRVRLFRWTPLGYLVGTAILLLLRNHLSASAGSLLLIIAAGIDSTTALVLGQEVFPKPIRSIAFYVMLNFSNFGGLLLAILALTLDLSPYRPAITLSIPFGLAIVSWYLRRDLEDRRRQSFTNKSRIGPSLPFYRTMRFALAVVFSYVNASGFALATYALGAVIYSHRFIQFLLFGTSGAFLAGLFSPILARIPLKTLLVGSNVATLVMATAIAWTASLHEILWIGLSIGTGIAFLAENEFKTAAWASSIRGRATAWERVGGQTGYAITLLITKGLSFRQFSWALVGVWCVGALAAIIWFALAS